jgi:cytosolic carboxypeptidase protein 2/3
MILRESKQQSVRKFIDMHGHSRKKNVFFCGCCPEGQDIQEHFYPRTYPLLMSKIHEPISYQDCSFAILPDKEGTARVALCNCLRIDEIYTLEASFCSSRSYQHPFQDKKTP